MSFTATTPAPSMPDIVIDDFYPSVSPDEFREHYRVDSTYHSDVVERVLYQAIVDVTDDLESWADIQKNNGHTTLSAVQSRTINGRSRLIILFEQAIYCFAKAGLMDTFRDIDTTRNLGDKRSDDNESTNDYWLSKARYAINKIMGQPEIQTELI